MAPATVAGVTVRRGTSTGTGAKRVEWSRDTIINAIQEWVATYDEPPRAADWNPSSAKWSGQTWRIELPGRPRRRDGLALAERRQAAVRRVAGRRRPRRGVRAVQAGTASPS
jgi:hypothetical protein